MSNMLSNINEHSVYTVILTVGTKVRAAVDYFAAHCRRHGINFGDGHLVRVIEIDAQQDAAAAGAMSAADEPDTRATLPVTFLAAQVHDAESLEKLESQGRFYFAPQDWASKDGQAKHTAGSGADPRYARALFECIRPQIRKAISDAIDTYLDYRRQEEKVLQTNREPDGAAIRFIVPYTTLGGMGPGLLHAVEAEIALVAQRHALNVRLITIGLCMGTIEPVNPPQGIRNEQALLHYAQADMVADLDYTQNGRSSWTPAAESAILLSNQNHHGAIPTLDRLQHLLGLFIFQYICTPIGRLLDERIVDIEKDRASDEYGEPLRTSTFGMAVLHLDDERLLRYAGNDLMKSLCEALLKEPADRRPVRQTALQDARALKVVETGDEPLASRQAAQLETFGGVNLFDRVRSVFEMRLQGLTGLRLCQAMISARRTTVSVDLERNLAPALRQASAALRQNALAGFRQTTSSFLARIDGLRLTQHYLADLRTLVEASADANLRALRALSESLRTVHETLADLESQVNDFANLSPFIRFFLAGRVRSLGRSYHLAADADLRGQAELCLHQALAEHLFRPLLAALGEEAARIDGHISRFEALRNCARTNMETIAAQTRTAR